MISLLLTRIRKDRGRIAELALGHAVNKFLIDWPFNYAVYPYIVYRFGLLRGGLAMAGLSFLFCIGSFRFYDWSKRDWLGIEMIKGLKVYEGRNSFRRVLAYLLAGSEPAAFLWLTLWKDPFITTLYLRRGTYDGLKKRDWVIFLGSFVIGVSYWAVVCWTGVNALKWAWNRLIR